jgi:hypothetical protein
MRQPAHVRRGDEPSERQRRAVADRRAEPRRHQLWTGADHRVANGATGAYIRGAVSVSRPPPEERHRTGPRARGMQDSPGETPEVAVYGMREGAPKKVSARAYGGRLAR